MITKLIISMVIILIIVCHHAIINSLLTTEAKHDLDVMIYNLLHWVLEIILLWIIYVPQEYINVVPYVLLVITVVRFVVLSWYINTKKIIKAFIRRYKNSKRFKKAFYYELWISFLKSMMVAILALNLIQIKLCGINAELDRKIEIKSKELQSLEREYEALMDEFQAF